MLSFPQQLVLGATIVALLFIIVGHIFRDSIQSVLKQPLCKVESFNLDWWSVTHFMLFAFFGFVMPGYPLSFFSLGVLFEVFEDGMSSDETTQLVDCTGKKDKFIHTIMCNGFPDSYWYGKADDVVVNLLGYIVGQAIRTTFNIRI